MEPTTTINKRINAARTPGGERLSGSGSQRPCRMLSSSEACEWSVGPGLVEAVGTHDESNFSSDSPPD